MRFFEKRVLFCCTLAFVGGVVFARFYGFAWSALALALVGLCFVRVHGAAVFKRWLLLACAACVVAGAMRYEAAQAAKPALPTSAEQGVPASADEGVLTGTLADDAYLSGGGSTLNAVLENAIFDGSPLGGRVLCRIYLGNYSEENESSEIDNSLPNNGINPSGYDTELSQHGAKLHKYATDLPTYGATMRITARLRLPKGRRNPGGYDEEIALSTKGIAYTASGQRESIEMLAYEVKISPYGALLRFRGEMKLFLENTLTPRQASLLLAMLFGDKSMLDEEVHEDFRASGAAHVLAVSGLHVMALAGALAWVLRKARVSPGATALFTGALMFVYCVLGAFSASLVRASIMAMTIVCAGVVGRRQDTITSLSAAAIVILLANPYHLFAPGFQLSFSAVLGIYSLAVPIQKLILRISYKCKKKIYIMLEIKLDSKGASLVRMVLGPKSVTYPKGTGVYSRVLGDDPEISSLFAFIKRLTDTVTISIAATIGTLPAMLSGYGSVVVTGVFTNVLAVPLAGIVVVAGLPFAAVGAVWPLATAWFSPVIGAALDVMAACANVFAFDGGVVYLPPMPIWATFAFLCAILLCRVHIKLKKRAMITAFCAFIAFAIGIGYHLLPPNGTQVIMLDVGQGDSFLIRSGGKAVLIDAGSSARTLDYGESVVLPALRAMGVMRLDAAIVTHSDDDHMGGMKVVIESMKTGVLLGDFSDEKCAALLESARRRNTRVVAPNFGDTLEVGDAKLKILSRRSSESTNDTYNVSSSQLYNVTSSITYNATSNVASNVISNTTSNETSIIALLTCGEVSVLFTGDADAALERTLDIGRVDVLKVAHHGSRFSTSAEFLERISPKAALLSVGSNNYGHPSPDVISRLEASGSRVFSTEQYGAVVVSIFNDEVVVSGTLRGAVP